VGSLRAEGRVDRDTTARQRTAHGPPCIEPAVVRAAALDREPGRQPPGERPHGSAHARFVIGGHPEEVLLLGQGAHEGSRDLLGTALGGEASAHLRLDLLAEAPEPSFELVSGEPVRELVAGGIALPEQPAQHAGGVDGAEDAVLEPARRPIAVRTAPKEPTASRAIRATASSSPSRMRWTSSARNSPTSRSGSSRSSPTSGPSGKYTSKSVSKAWPMTGALDEGARKGRAQLLAVEQVDDRPSPAARRARRRPPHRCPHPAGRARSRRRGRAAPRWPRPAARSTAAAPLHQLCSGRAGTVRCVRAFSMSVACLRSTDSVVCATPSSMES
jgi:hypothetical protein